MAWDHCSVEITNLLVTDENDSEDQVRELVEWAASVSPDLPIHLSRYHPTYKMSAPPTPVDRIQRAAEIARESLNYVYVGNIRVDGGGDTVCPDCGEIIVNRSGYATTSRLTEDGRCPECGRSVNVTV
jgi:pyruvate formate lyase activating enzyme